VGIHGGKKFMEKKTENTKKEINKRFCWASSLRLQGGGSESGAQAIAQIRPVTACRELPTYIFYFFQLMVFLHRNFLRNDFCGDTGLRQKDSGANS
jgi:hypothetical protein